MKNDKTNARSSNTRYTEIKGGGDQTEVVYICIIECLNYANIDKILTFFSKSMHANEPEDTT